VLDVDLRDETGNTALHVACRRGQKRAMKALLRAGANVLACNEDGLTPLHFTEASRTPSPPPPRSSPCSLTAPQ
jgi:ankyrin repeat protein